MTGRSFTSSVVVDTSVTARALGSGDLDVLATPAMIALMENAAMQAVAGALPEGATTVGGAIDCVHLKPSPVGRTVTATAEVTAVDGPKITFAITAHDGETLIGQATHTRFVVDRKRFLERLADASPR